MAKPTYYLWQKDYQTSTAYERQKELYTRLGFRVVTFCDGSSENDINDGMKALIKNHMADERSS